MREVQGLFQDFAVRRPYLDEHTRALNDAAVRILVDEVIKVRRRGATS